MLTKLIMCSAIAATLFSGGAVADNVTPSSAITPISYIVAITPDIDTMRIAGTETIELNANKASDQIQFNYTNQKICRVRFDGEPVQTITLDPATHLATIKLHAPAKLGKHHLSFAFVGTITHDMHGMFVQPYAKRNSVKGEYLTATFEGSDTQKVFPGFDQATFPAPVQLSITVPSDWAAWASLPIDHKEVHGEFTTIAYKSSADFANNALEFSGGSLMQNSINMTAKN